MHVFPGYAITEQLYESSTTLVYRGQRDGGQQPVIIKVLREVFPSLERLAWFRQEYQILHSLDLEGVVRAYGLEESQQRWVLLLEDFGGDSLRRLKWAGQLSLPCFLRLAIDIADILGEVHARQVVHKDITLDNIVCHPTTCQVKVVDFSIATVLSRQEPEFCHPSRLQGTLAYMSPEQTGRVNRPVDYRTDFYSFGVTLYELLTGRLPFVCDDALEMVHSHLTRQPVPPHEVVELVEGGGSFAALEAVSAVILRLLAKNAEDRYQSAYGIRADLEGCLALVEGGDGATISHFWSGGAFVPGRYDVRHSFGIPQRLYGREYELEMLLTIFDQVSQGGRGLVLVAGDAGIGKTALVKELYGPVTAHRGFFVSGKFDQVLQDGPYSAFVQGCRSLLRLLLTEAEEEIAVWRERLQLAVGGYGQVVVEVVPELEAVLGPQPSVSRLEPLQAEYRFLRVFGQFLQVFAQPGHPLVLFLDDLHRADGASLRLLEYVLTGGQCHHLLVIGTYRDREVGERHALLAMLAAVEGALVDDAAMTVHLFLLESLDVAAVTVLVMETLGCEEGRARPLAELVVAKTGGNPFFVNEFLTTLFQDGLIWFEGGGSGAKEDEQVGYGWRWSLDAIRARGLTDNVVDLLTWKIRQLDEQTQQVLKLAACVGNRFLLVRLAMVAQRTVFETARDLRQAVAEGLVVAPGNGHALMMLDVPGLEDAVPVEYAFAHDRIQQAVYALLPEPERQRVHWRIGHLLLAESSGALRQDAIFDIVHQFDQGLVFVADQMGRHQLARLYVQAGKRAKAATAYESASGYFQTGLDLLVNGAGNGARAGDFWQEQYELALVLHEESAEAALLVGQWERVGYLVGEVLGRAQSVLDMVRCYEVQIQAYMAQNRSMDAVQTALEVLGQLGFPFPDAPGDDDVRAALDEVRAALGGRSFAELADLPVMREPYELAAMQVLGRVTAAAYGLPVVFPLVVLKQVSLSLRSGNAPESCFAYVTYGIMLCGMFDDIEGGYQVGRVGVRLLGLFDAPHVYARTMMAFLFTIRHWKEPVREFLPTFLEVYQRGVETGDLLHACYSLYHYDYMAFLVGVELETLRDEMSGHIETMREPGREGPLIWDRLLLQTVLNLLGESEDVGRLQGTAFDETSEVAGLREVDDALSLFLVFFHKVLLCFLMGDVVAAQRWLEEAQGLVHGAVSLPYLPVLAMYDSLIRLAVAGGDAGEEEGVLERVAANRERLQHWAGLAPANVWHRLVLVEAELARFEGRDGEARESYDRAIALAQEYGFVQDEALACELAGVFYLAKGAGDVANVYLHRAYVAYGRWGALVKVRDMERRYPAIWWQDSGDSVGVGVLGSGSSRFRSDASVFDFISIIKASQAIASEIVLDNLLSKLLHIVMENAGAGRGVLVLDRMGCWVVEAEGKVGARWDDEAGGVGDFPLQVATFPGQGRELEGSVPMAIVNYVAHTREYVVLHDARQEHQFSQDGYIRERQPRSVLCLPLVHRGVLLGMVYLEHEEVEGVFTPGRLEVLVLLSGQAVISIEQARLYARMEELVEDRTATLTQTNLSLRHEIVERQRAEDMLLRARDDLDRRIRERTAELSEANRALQAEIVERRQAEEAYRLLVEHSLQGLCIFQGGRFLVVNPTMALITGYSVDELRAMTSERIKAMIYPDDQQQVWSFLQGAQLGQSSSLQFEYRIFRKDGMVRWLEAYAIQTDYLGMVAFQLVCVDVTDQKAAEGKLQHLALHDALTNLPNRALFMELLGHALKYARRHGPHPFAVLFLDLDNFKVINDSLGHLAGDQLLVVTAGRLKACLRTSDTVARLGGDEFAILLEELADINDAIALTNRIQQELSIPLMINGHEVITSASIGIVLHSQEHVHPVDMLRDADTAMNRAKQMGSGHYAVFDTAMHAQMVQRLHMESALRRAIEHEELVLHYQPIVDLSDGCMSGFEALVRWWHPQRGLVFPDEFIPVAEETGLIVPLGWWILFEGCRQVRVWQEQFPELAHLSVNINLSSQAFADVSIVDQIERILSETGLDGSCLKLEITENMMMDHAEATIVTLNRLRDLGVGLCIDDFGTGYSSLRYLHRFPVQVLKIDKSFTFALGVDEGSTAIIQSMVMMSHTLGKEVVAEGIENLAQLGFLRGLPCEYGQGYFFSRPLDVAAVEGLLRSGGVFSLG